MQVCDSNTLKLRTDGLAGCAQHTTAMHFDGSEPWHVYTVRYILHLIAITELDFI
jgi:hypothetical protein